MRLKISFIFLLLTGCFATLLSQPLQRVKPEEVDLNPLKLKSADDAIYASIRKGQIPGAVLAVVRHGKLAYLKAYGYKQTFPSREPMSENTIFDLASLTKPLATAISAMILVERGQLDLNDSVSKYIPDYKNWTYPSGVTQSIKIKDLMTHTSGLPAYAPYARLRVSLGSPNPEGFMKYISSVNRLYAPETKFTYSCLNFITLQHVIEGITKQSLRDFAKQNIYDVLGMKYTDFKPSGALLQWVAPTERTKEGILLRGVVQDPLARWMNDGISGNAGLFSNASDIAILIAALQNGGAWNAQRILTEESVKKMRTVPQELSKFGRALGWDVASVYASIKGDFLSPNTYLHTGYTGTSVVIDPDNDLSIILLTNRIHPTDKGSVKQLRIAVSNAVASALIR